MAPMDMSQLALQLAVRAMGDDEHDGHNEHGAMPDGSPVNAGAGMASGMHGMSPYLFIRSTGFFVLFKEANIQSTGAFVAALAVSFLFTMIATVFAEVSKKYETRFVRRGDGSFSFKSFIAAALFGFRLLLHYITMLIVMTMNVWLIIAVVAGHAAGFLVYAFTPAADGISAGKARADCCE